MSFAFVLGTPHTLRAGGCLRSCPILPRRVLPRAFPQKRTALVFMTVNRSPGPSNNDIPKDGKIPASTSRNAKPAVRKPVRSGSGPASGSGDFGGVPGGSRGSGGDGRGDDEDDEDDDDEDEDDDDDDDDDDFFGPLLSASSGRVKEVDVEIALARMRKLLKKAKAATHSVSDDYFGTRMAALLRNVPASVLVAFISLVSTVAGTRYKVHLDKMAAEEALRADDRQKKEEIELELRENYMELVAPILKSAAKLAERLYFLIDSKWDSAEEADFDDTVLPGRDGPAYSAYLLGRYLAMVENVKRENSLLDYGFPAADRILANILGRVQGVLCANDERLMEMQTHEHTFQPLPGRKPLRSGLLNVKPHVQTVLGELLLRKLYNSSGIVPFIDSADKEEGDQRTVVSFLEFSRLLEEDATVSRWYKPVIRDFIHLERLVRRLPRSKRRCDAIGARLYFLQAGLLDLVGFFDPMPHAKAIQSYRRRRLLLGEVSHAEEQRTPPSLRVLYRELANIRDRREAGGCAIDRLRLPHGGVEVHVKAARVEQDGVMPSAKYGDCPHSHRVLIVMEELGVPYKKVLIPSDAKPAWYYLLHPENRTPVMYHDGNLIEDSKHIVAYLLERFAPARGKLPLASAAKLELAVGTAGLTKFHDHFIEWVSGREASREKLERELQKLDRTIERAQKKNATGAFLGGSRFARADTAIAPMLNNVEIAGRALKQWGIPEECRAIRKYLEEARKVPSFVKTAGDEETIVEGYEGVAKTGGKKVAGLADMLE